MGMHRQINSNPWLTYKESHQQSPDIVCLLKMILSLSWSDLKNNIDPLRIIKKSFARHRKHGWKGMVYRLTKEYCLIKGQPISVLEDDTYPLWIEQCEPFCFANIDTFTSNMMISIILPVYSFAPDKLKKTIESILSQRATNWELFICISGSISSVMGEFLAGYAAGDTRIKLVSPTDDEKPVAIGRAVEHASGSFILIVKQDGILSEYAVSEFALAAETNNYDLIYCDEDSMDSSGLRYDHYFKPDFSIDLLLSHDYISNCFLVRKSIFRNNEAISNFQLLVSMLDSSKLERIFNIKKILHHVQNQFENSIDKNQDFENHKISVIESYINHCGSNASVSSCSHNNNYRVKWNMSYEPLVSLIIPTRDRIDLLRPCIESILTRTTYTNFDITIVNNQSIEESTLAYFDSLSSDPRIRILDYAGPFNYSAICNLAVKSAAGELIGLLNNDVEVISPDWLNEMASHAVRDGVGCVGAKLLFPDNTVQHAGVILGIGGIAGHAHRYVSRYARGYHDRLNLTQNVSAVTAACLLVKKTIYQQVGGMEEVHLPVSLNDVDFCLKVREAGYRNIYTPFAELYHHESKSRGKDDTEEKRERHKREREFMQQKWGDVLQDDPFYSPHLTREHEQFQLLTQGEITSFYNDKINLR